MSKKMIMPEAEKKKQGEPNTNKASWKTWGPYLSERQWGTVREDYSWDGNPWEYFPHDNALSRTYRWGEDGIAGISDEQQLLCFSVSFWNGKDPIIKERLFGLDHYEGNRGENVKEYYYHLDNVPNHSYMKYLYKYPQGSFPYNQLITANKARTNKEDTEELGNTGIFDEDRYFDVVVEYAKENPEDICIRISVTNNGPDAATLFLLPTLWFRNTWSWNVGAHKPSLIDISEIESMRVIKVVHPTLETYWLYCDDPYLLLFTENETNLEKLYQSHNSSMYVKDGINNYLVHGKHNAINPRNVGTKAAIYYNVHLEPSESKVFKLRLSNQDSLSNPFGNHFNTTLNNRKKEAEIFYAEKFSGHSEIDQTIIKRALSGLLWSKQFYYYDVKQWLEGDALQPKPPETRWLGRNHQWQMFKAFSIVNVPDKWKYPWFSMSELPFACLALALIDPELAKHQFLLFTHKPNVNSNGKIPSQEWNFDQSFFPIQAWVARLIYETDSNHVDTRFLESLVASFSKDLEVKSQEELDRHPSWLSMYAINLFRICEILVTNNPNYTEVAKKVFSLFMNLNQKIQDFALSLPKENKVGLMSTDAEGIYKINLNTLWDIIPFLVIFSDILKYQKEIKSHFPDFKLDKFIDFNLLKSIIEIIFNNQHYLSPFGLRIASKKYNPLNDNPTIQSFTKEFPDKSQLISLSLNFLIINTLYELHQNINNDILIDFKNEQLSLLRCAQLLCERIISLFQNKLINEEKNSLFYEYYHSESGLGMGACNFTGSSALVANLIQHPLWKENKKTFRQAIAGQR